MGVKADAAGRRAVELSLELAGTPHEVWQAIATSAGISSWFVPATFEEQDGVPVAVTLDFGGGMLSRSAVTRWEPEHAFIREGAGWAPGSPALATEFYVEPRDAHTTVFRVVQSLVADSDQWDKMLLGAEAGWPEIFRVLQLYFTHFRGMPCASAKVMVPVPVSVAAGWDTLTTALAVKHAAPGDHWRAPASAPALGGVVSHVNSVPVGLMVRLDTPCPGIAAFGMMAYGTMVMAGVTFFFYGEQAAAAAAAEQPTWTTWVAELFAGADGG